MKLILKFFWFVLVSFVLSSILDIIITKGLQNHFSYDTEVMIDLRDSTINPDFLILGSCQAGCSYNPAIFDSVLNVNSYAFSAYNLTMPAHICLWDLYKSYHAKLPQYVLFTIDYSDLHMIPLKGCIVEKQFIPLVYNKVVRDYMLTHGGFSIFDIYTPLYRYFGYHQFIKDGILGFLGIRNGTRNRYKGYEQMSTGYSFAREEYASNNYIIVDDKYIELLINWLEECLDLGVKPILITAPLGFELAEKIVNADDVYNVCQSLAKEYNIPYLQYQNHPISKDTSMFNSPAHLNYIGTEVFSKIVTDSLLTIQY